MTQSLLFSNEPAYVCHFLSILEELWKTGIDGVDSIKDIEAGASLTDIEVIQSSSRAREQYLELVKNAHKEIIHISFKWSIYSPTKNGSNTTRVRIDSAGYHVNMGVPYVEIE